MRDRGRPNPFSRFMFRAPILLYRLKLGWLLGKRFLRITQIGRKTGLARDVVVEVVDHRPEHNVFVVAAAWGERSDWYRNIMQTPEVMVQVGNKRWPGIAHRLQEPEARAALAEYARKHATAFRSLSKLLGFESTDIETSLNDMAREMPMIALRPRVGENVAAGI